MIERVRNFFVCTLLAVLVTSVVYGILFIRAATAVVAAMPAEVDATRAALVGEVRETRAVVLAEVDRQATGIRRDAVGQIAALRIDALARVDGVRSDLNAHVDWLGRMVDFHAGQAAWMLNGQLGRANDSVALVAKAVPPVLEQSKALVQKTQELIDDNYDELSATIQSADVAVTGAARAADEVANAAPAMSKSVTGIADDVHTLTHDFVKPQTAWQKIKSWLETAGKIGARFL